MKRIAGVMAAFICYGSVSLAQTDNQIIDKPINSTRQLEMIDSISVALNEFYIFPDVAKEIEKYIRKQYHEDTYQNIASTKTFTEKLTDDIRLVSKDAHLSVEFKSDEYFASPCPH